MCFQCRTVRYLDMLSRFCIPTLVFLIACSPGRAPDADAPLNVGAEGSGGAGQGDAAPQNEPDAGRGFSDYELADLPQLARIAPSQGVVDEVGPAIVVSGRNFVPRTVVQLGGAVLPTTYVGPTELRATIPSDRLTAVGTLQVTVGTAPPGGGASRALAFEVVYGAPLLTAIVSPSPPSVLVGAADTEIAVAGSKFGKTSTLTFEGAALPTMRDSASLLRAVVPASSLTRPGSFKVTVSTPAPGGGVSSPLAFTVTQGGVTLQSISPDVADIGSGPVTVTLSGTGFHPLSEV
jgi:IPT/TIG domain